LITERVIHKEKLSESRRFSPREIFDKKMTTIYTYTEQTLTQNSVKKDKIIRNQERIDNLERLLKIQDKIIKE